VYFAKNSINSRFRAQDFGVNRNSAAAGYRKVSENGQVQYLINAKDRPVQYGQGVQKTRTDGDTENGRGRKKPRRQKGKKLRKDKCDKKQRS